MCWLISLAAAVLLLSETVAAQLARPMRDTDVVARVNGTPIYRKAVREVVQGLLSLQEGEPAPEAIGKLVQESLNSLIALELLYQESHVRGIRIAEAAIDEEIERSRARFPNAQAFQQALKSKGLSETEFRQETRKTLAVNQLLEQAVWKDLDVPASEVAAYYQQHRQQFKHPAEIRVSRILIRAPEQPAGAREKPKHEAEQLLSQLRAGADFAQLAREHSQDPLTGPRGGDMGFLARGEMDLAFEEQAFALPAGQVSDVVSTPYGFEIIKVTERREAGYDSIDEVRDRVRSELLEGKRQERQAAFVAQLRKKTKVELLDAAAR